MHINRVYFARVNVNDPVNLLDSPRWDAYVVIVRVLVANQPS